MKREITLTVTAKGQVTLKQSVLHHLGVKPGDPIIVDLCPAHGVMIRAAPQANIDAFFACLPVRNQAVSIEDMNKAIEEGWAGKR